MVEPIPSSSPPGAQMLSMPLRWIGAALIQAALTWIAALYSPSQESLSIFNPAAGWALAVLIHGGPRYAGAVFIGTWLAHVVLHAPWAWGLGAAAGNAAGALLGRVWLARACEFDPQLPTVRQHGQLLLYAILPAATLSAATNLVVSTLLAWPAAQSWAEMGITWWMGDVLGMAIITPLVLIWVLQPLQFYAQHRWLEAALAGLITILLGSMILLDRFADLLPFLPRRGYWLFPLIVWIAARLGRRAVLIALGLLAMQTSWGLHLHTGFLAQGHAGSTVWDGWGFLVALSIVGIFLATTLREIRTANQNLRIAACAFECQEGMIITDAQQRVLRVNRSSTQITGYEEAEIKGLRLPDAFMRSDRHPESFCNAAWSAAREQGHWADEMWNQRKNGEIFPQSITISAVKNDSGSITHFVVTHTDISDRKQREAQTLAHQTQQRNALVREVHHRIKNHLQGITGLLKQHATERPDIAEPLQQAISQVRSIAVIHGLQGSSLTLQVRLCELVPMIAQEVGALWRMPVRIDRPIDWVPCLVAEAEAVPLALIVNELVTNAIKHAHPRAQPIEVRLRKGTRADQLSIRISNPGSWHGGDHVRSGLQLVQAMLPPSGAQLTHIADAGMVHVTLTLEPPIIALETATLHVNPPHPPPPPAAGR